MQIVNEFDTEAVLPRRAKETKDRELPSANASKAEKEDPNLAPARNGRDKETLVCP
jgi:hypothetical protein